MTGLTDKVQQKNALIGIIGLGYVGLPLALAFCEAGFKVLGFDVKKERVDAVNQGQSYIADVSKDRLKIAVSKKALQATLDQSHLKEVDIICICVPTPLTKAKEPDLSYVIRESQEILKYLRRGQLVVLESTTYPGTTRGIVLPILESSELKVGSDFYLAFSPERVDPGSKTHTLKNTPKIVGGIDTESTRIASLLYRQVAESVVPASSADVAEMTKVFENVFRSVNIALVNELAQLCHKIGISVWEVIDAASSKPFGYMPLYPGPGIGGHCIPLDPYYLANRAREYDFHTRFIELAAEINEEMPYYVVSRIMDALNSWGKSLKGASLLILGVTYKKDVPDIRESPSCKIIKLLQEKGGNVSYNDPYIASIQISPGGFESVELTEEVLAATDCVVIATDHSCYDYKGIADKAKLVFDTRGATRKLAGSNIIRL